MCQIEIKNLTKKYGKKVIFCDINFKFTSNNIYFLTDKNGLGKTTFMRCLLRETSYLGQIIDQNIVYTYMPERVILPSYTTVYNFLKLFLKDLDNIVIEEYLKLFGIVEYKNKYLNHLSKGTAQKVLLIKTLITDADVYLFDEPLNGLDMKSRNSFVNTIKYLNQLNKIVIIATHYYDDYLIENKVEIKLKCGT